MHPARHRQGFSIIELMIAVALVGIVVSQLLLVFTSQHKSYLQQERVVETQVDLRLLTDFIIRDIRMAGFMVPHETAVGSIDGGTANQDVICMSDSRVLVEAEFDSATGRFDAASVTSLVSGSVGSVTLSAASMDIDGDGNDDFADGNGILVSDGDDVHCGLITDVTGNVVSFGPDTGSGTNMSPISTWAVPAVIYQLSGTTLSRNTMTLSNQVDDLQVEWWVDTNNNADIDAGEFPIHDLDGQDTSKVRLGRVSLTTRSSTPDPTFDGQRAAIANRNAGAADNFRRRRAITDARLRNAR